MQAISNPTPKRPPQPLPFATPSDNPPTASRYRLWLTISLVGLVGFATGFALRQPVSPTASPPDVHTTMQWMFDAALAHDAATADGTAVLAAVPGVVVEEVETVDPLRGPMVAIISDDQDNLTAYRIVVQRHDLNWSVTATRLAG